MNPLQACSGCFFSLIFLLAVYCWETSQGDGALRPALVGSRDSEGGFPHGILRSNCTYRMSGWFALGSDVFLDTLMQRRGSDEYRERHGSRHGQRQGKAKLWE